MAGRAARRGRAPGGGPPARPAVAGRLGPRLRDGELARRVRARVAGSRRDELRLLRAQDRRAAHQPGAVGRRAVGARPLPSLRGLALDLRRRALRRHAARRLDRLLVPPLADDDRGHAGVRSPRSRPREACALRPRLRPALARRGVGLRRAARAGPVLLRARGLRRGARVDARGAADPAESVDDLRAGARRARLRRGARNQPVPRRGGAALGPRRGALHVHAVGSPPRAAAVARLRRRDRAHLRRLAPHRLALRGRRLPRHAARLGRRPRRRPLGAGAGLSRAAARGPARSPAAGRRPGRRR